MKAWLATQRHWLRVEQLPGYAYDLNPIEQVWGNLEIQRTGQPVPRHHRRGTGRRPSRPRPRRQRLRPMFQLPRPCRTTFMTANHPITERSLTPRVNQSRGSPE
ncbi:hypothetical protein AB0J47_39305 [Nocardia sp. NPDC049737]|uniref:hypothetical protein n=1 Tax=Nocardia sp. NPDC049737 TaxID=3154358 RepID=UPI0034495D85